MSRLTKISSASLLTHTPWMRISLVRKGTFGIVLVGGRSIVGTHLEDARRRFPSRDDFVDGSLQLPGVFLR